MSIQKGGLDDPAIGGETANPATRRPKGRSSATEPTAHGTDLCDPEEVRLSINTPESHRVREQRRLHAATFARQNVEHINALRERDRQLAGETVKVLIRRAGGCKRQLVDVVVDYGRRWDQVVR